MPHLHERRRHGQEAAFRTSVMDALGPIVALPLNDPNDNVPSISDSDHE